MIFRKKILVTGGAGTVASYIYDVFSPEEIALTTHKTLDVTSAEAVKTAIKTIQPKCILHLAALTNVDFCELNKKIASGINHEGTKHLAIQAKKHNIPLVYVSTSAVFSGENPDGYIENDEPDPKNFYAKTKLLGENAVKEYVNDYLIVRAGWIIGGGK